MAEEVKENPVMPALRDLVMLMAAAEKARNTYQGQDWKTDGKKYAEAVMKAREVFDTELIRFAQALSSA